MFLSSAEWVERPSPILMFLEIGDQRDDFARLLTGFLREHS